MPKTTQKALKAINKQLEYADSSDLLELIIDICRNIPLATDFLNVKLGIIKEREFLELAKSLIDKELAKNHLKYNAYYDQKEFSFKKEKIRNILKDLKNKTDKIDLEIEFLLYSCYQLSYKCNEVYDIQADVGISSYTVSAMESLFRSCCNLIAKKSTMATWEGLVDDLIEETNKLFAKTSSYIDFWSNRGGEPIRGFINPIQNIKLEYLG